MSPAPVAIRRLLLFTLVVGLLGTAVELLLLGHIDGWQQLIPLVLLAASVVVVIIQARKPTPTANATLLGTMCVFVISGAVGVAMHFQGNVEFEREMYPQMGGFELIRKTMTGATPVLAPGTMALLGLVGIAYVRVGEAAARRDGLEY
jgi:hypothetical protein